MDKEYLIKKWLDNDLSKDEVEAFKALDDAPLYQEIIEEAQRFSGEQKTKASTFETLEKRLVDKKTTAPNWIRIVSGIAAIFIIGITLFSFWDNDTIHTIATDYKQKETIALPDNSLVELNTFSQLRYNASTWDKKRTLELKGEAYFDVETGSKFEVETDFGNVAVLGTEFNVIARDTIFKVSCYEGLVQVKYNTKVIELPAGTEFVLKAGNGEKSQIAIAEPHWLKNMSVFENATIDVVFKELENQYNIKVVNAVTDNEKNFTGAFEHSNLDNALKSITQPLNLTYSISNNKVVTISDAKK